jgi:hypothetical protein
MTKSLLGQFYSQIKGSQEDIASRGLAYILNESQNARNAINEMLVSCGLKNIDITEYETQVTTKDVDGESEIRPDIIGFEDGKEKLIIETKFWSSLTQNQPVKYLNQHNESPVLMFICPEKRIGTLSFEIKKKLVDAQLIAEQQEHPNKHIFTIRGSRHVVIRTWNDVIKTIQLQLDEKNEQGLISDLWQLKGFCDIIDSDMFQPFQYEDFSPCFAKKVLSFYKIVDGVIEQLKSEKKADTTNLTYGGSNPDYIKYFNLVENNKKTFGCGLGIRLNILAKGDIADTPFWFYIKELGDANRWQKQSQSFKTHLKSVARIENTRYYEDKVSLFKGELFLAIPIDSLIGKMEEDVINDIVGRIERIICELKKVQSESK